MADEAEKPSVNSIIGTAQERFEKAKTAYQSNRALAIDDTKFVLGDSDNGWQWPTDIYRQRATVDKKPCLTVNVTRQHCNQIINNIRQNRPQCKVLPGDERSSKKAAEIYAGLIRGIQAASQADVAHDEAAKHAVYGGEGYWRILTDWAGQDSFDQVILIAPVENPQLVYIDPFCGLDKKKAQWGFVFEDISKDEAKRRYGDKGIDPSTWGNDTARGWVSEHTIRVAEYYYCEQVPDTLFMLGDGSVRLESDLRKEAEKAGIPADERVAQVKAQAKAMEDMGSGKKSRPTTRTQWKHCKLVGGHDTPLEEKVWPGMYLPIIQVVGDETNVNGEIVRKGIVRDLKDPARMVNYSYSAAIETVALQSKVPYVGPADAFEGFEDEWKGANASNKAFLPYNHVDDEGNPIPMPQRQQPAVMPAAQVQLLSLSVEQMRAASGQQNANFGIKSEAQSGVGIQRLKVQGETATFHFPDNLARALHDEAVILIDLIPHVYDTRRVVTLLGMDGKEEKALIAPDLDGPYADMDEEDVKMAFNPSVGKYGVVIDTGPSYQTQRQEGAAAMTELASRNPALLQVAGDIIMRAYDFPFSEQLADRLKKTIPPELQDEDKGGEGEIPPQVAAAMQQLHDQMGQMQQAGAELQENLAAAEQKLEAETSRRLKLEIQVAEKDAIARIQQAEQQMLDALRGEQEQMQQQAAQGMEGQPQEPAPQDTTLPALEAVLAGIDGLTQAIGAMAQDRSEQSMAINAAILQRLEQPAQPRQVSIARQGDGSLQGVIG